MRVNVQDFATGDVCPCLPRSGQEQVVEPIAHGHRNDRNLPSRFKAETRVVEVDLGHATFAFDGVPDGYRQTSQPPSNDSAAAGFITGQGTLFENNHFDARCSQAIGCGCARRAAADDNHIVGIAECMMVHLHCAVR